VLAAAKINPTAELSRRASAVATRAEGISFLTSAWQQALAAGVSPSDAERSLKNGILQVLPGDAKLIPAKELKVQQQLQANQYVGIGIALSGKDGVFTMNLFPNGPADRAGAKTGDRIEAIDGTTTKGLNITGVVDRLRGPEGSEVTLLLKRGDEEQTLTITRGVVPRETIAGRSRADERWPWNYQADPALPIAYVRISEIGGSTVHELRQIEQKLRASGMKALIIDLTSIHTSDPHHATMCADALLAGGTIGRIREGDQVKEIAANSDCLFQDWPLAVLVSEFTSGTAEWLVAALQDNHRATVVGTATPGTAYVTRPFPIADTDEMLIVPTGTLERPSGKPLAKPFRLAISEERPVSINDHRPTVQSWGVQPDHLSGVTRPGAPGGPIAMLQKIPYQNRLFQQKQTDPVSIAVDVLRSELENAIRRNESTNSGN
jgi:C-terminal peptidase prc